MPFSFKVSGLPLRSTALPAAIKYTGLEAGLGVAALQGVSEVQLVVKDLVTGIIKPFLFGTVLVTISCYSGLSVTSGAEGVGQATTRAVVLSTVCIIAADALCTWFFYYVFNA